MSGPTNMPNPFESLITLAMLPYGEVPDSARVMAQLSLFDWMVVGLAGKGEPLSRIVTQLVQDEGGVEAATLFGGGRVPARAAALANGTISHALDYDDTHFGHIGHLSVGILPAALAVGEDVNADAATVLDGFIVGAEAAIRLGMSFGRDHYQRGFHQTATAGAFGATVAAGRILGLTESQMRHALSLVATRASGLTSQFGSMGKPFNAGMSASNGVEVAKLSRLGFLSCDDGVFCAQGFAESHCEAADTHAGWVAPIQAGFLFEDIKYKLHACCHGTHAMIEALRSQLRETPLDITQVKQLHLRVNPRWLNVCDVKNPNSGLEVKFSYVWLAGMVLNGVNTSADDTYTDALCSDPLLKQFAQQVKVVGDAAISDTATEGEIETTDGQRIPISYDLAMRVPVTELEVGLRSKAQSLLGAESADALWEAVADIEQLSARSLAGLIS